MGDNPFFLLAFLSAFHIIGAVAVGYAIRGIWQVVRGEGQIGILQSLFFVAWGGIFGCAPFGFGADPTLPGWFLSAQITIWLLAFVIAGVFGREVLQWLQPLANVHVLLMAVGGLFALGGLIAGWTTFTQGIVWVALVVGVVFIIIGGVIFALGLSGLFKDYG